MKNIKTYEQFVDEDSLTFDEFLDREFEGSNVNLSKVIELNCEDSNLIDLNGIKQFTNLLSLYCSNNRITSLKEIENLTKLQILSCPDNPIDWVDYIDKQGRTYYIKLPKTITELDSDKFFGMDEYWEFMEKNQPSGISHKFNF